MSNDSSLDTSWKLSNYHARQRREPSGMSGDMAETHIYVMPDGRVTGSFGSVLIWV